MVEQVFSDKTGTLTCNVMDFRKCSINGTSYGLGTTEIGRAYAQRMGLAIPSEPVRDPSDPVTPHVNFCDPTMKAALSNALSSQHDAIREFFLHLALNHEVMPELQGGRLLYSASNPDEAALVYAAKHFGAFFKSNELNELCVEIQGEVKKYELLHNLQFSSDRKRSSVIVRSPSGQLMLYCKGADNVIKKRLSPSANSETLVNTTYGHLDQVWDAASPFPFPPLSRIACPQLRFHELTHSALRNCTQYVNDGLRTLLIAKVDLIPEVYEKWRVQFEAATTAMQGRDAQMATLMNEIEQDLVLQGSTAIEDKLQGKGFAANPMVHDGTLDGGVVCLSDGVSDTLSSLRAGGILVWMLTGDKVDTAINIGFSCSLLTTDMDLLRLVADDGQMALDAEKVPLRDAIERVLAQLQNQAMDSSHQRALVIDTGALAAILKFELEAPMLELCNLCKSVICARVSPKQKARVVEMVRRARPGIVTLAIGDGANDVPMIQTANVGIGIFGLEGKQAVMSADYAVGQFRFLKPLLLVHGRWQYRRIAKVIVYMYYKSAVQVLPNFWFGFVTLFSGQFMYYDLMYQVGAIGRPNTRFIPDN